MAKIYFITSQHGDIISNAYTSKANLLAEYEYYPQNGEKIVEIDETDPMYNEIKSYL